MLLLVLILLFKALHKWWRINILFPLLYLVKSLNIIIRMIGVSNSISKVYSSFHAKKGVINVSLFLPHIIHLWESIHRILMGICWWFFSLSFESVFMPMGPKLSCIEYGDCMCIEGYYPLLFHQLDCNPKFVELLNWSCRLIFWSSLTKWMLTAILFIY